MSVEFIVTWFGGFLFGIGVMAVLSDYLHLRKQPKRDARGRFAKRGN